MLTEDTLRRLEEKQEELAILFLDQADSDKWRDLSTKKKRGDAVWLKKNAAETMTLVVKIQSLLNSVLRPKWGREPLPPESPPTDEEVQAKLVERAELEATAMIERVRGGKQ